MQAQARKRFSMTLVFRAGLVVGLLVTVSIPTLASAWMDDDIERHDGHSMVARDFKVYRGVEPREDTIGLPPVVLPGVKRYALIRLREINLLPGDDVLVPPFSKVDRADALRFLRENAPLATDTDWASEQLFEMNLLPGEGASPAPHAVMSYTQLLFREMNLYLPTANDAIEPVHRPGGHGLTVR